MRSVTFPTQYGTNVAMNLPMRHRDITLFCTPCTEGVSSVSFTPNVLPGGLITAVTSRARNAIGGHVASRMALDYFVEGCLTTWKEDNGLHSLEEGFKNANRAVFDFGARLSAGGRMAASLVAVALDRTEISVARAGRAAVYLLRDNKLFPFYEEEVLARPEDPVLGIHIGAQPKIAFQTAALPCTGGDSIILVPKAFTPTEVRTIEETFQASEREGSSSLSSLLRRLDFGIVISIAKDVVCLTIPIEPKKSS